jgi:hypothetical protein
MIKENGEECQVTIIVTISALLLEFIFIFFTQRRPVPQCKFYGSGMPP